MLEATAQMTGGPPWYRRRVRHEGELTTIDASTLPLISVRLTADRSSEPELNRENVRIRRLTASPRNQNHVRSQCVAYSNILFNYLRVPRLCTVAYVKLISASR